MATIIDTVNSYPAWTTVRFSTTFANSSNQLTDPATVLLFVAGPDGSVSQFSPIRDTVGTYHYDYYTATPGGTWYYRFLGQGSVNASSGDIPFKVETPEF